LVEHESRLIAAFGDSRDTNPEGGIKSSGIWNGTFPKIVRFIIDHLQVDGSYASADKSQLLRIRANEILGWLTADDSNHEPAWNRRLNQ
jgi:hypothetical protein